MYLRCRHFQGVERLASGFHEGPRPADERLPVGERGSQLSERGSRRQPLQRLQPVHHGQPVGILCREFPQRVGEDHRPLVAVGVDQHHLAAAFGQRRLANRQDRSDSAAGGQQQEVVVEGFGYERARRRQHVNPHAGMSVVAQPVRRVAVFVPFHGDGHRLVSERRAAQRIAAGDRAGSVAGNTQRQELAGGVAQPLRRYVGSGARPAP